MVIYWHRTQFLLLGGSVLMDILNHLLFATNLRLFGFMQVDFIIIFYYFLVIRDIF